MKIMGRRIQLSFHFTIAITRGIQPVRITTVKEKGLTNNIIQYIQLVKEKKRAPIKKIIQHLRQLEKERVRGKEKVLTKVRCIQLIVRITKVKKKEKVSTKTILQYLR